MSVAEKIEANVNVTNNHDEAPLNSYSAMMNLCFGQDSKPCLEGTLSNLKFAKLGSRFKNLVSSGVFIAYSFEI